MKREEWSAHDVNAYFDRLAAAQQSAEQEVELSEEGLMTRREVAEFLAVSVRTVQRIEVRGDLPRVTVRGLRLAFYRRRDVGQLLEPQKPAKFKLLSPGEWG